MSSESEVGEEAVDRITNTLNSKCWCAKHFKKVGTNKVVCTVCNNNVELSYRGPSNLKQQFWHNHNAMWIDNVRKEETASKITNFLVTTPFFGEKLQMWIIKKGIPFSMVEDNSFREMINNLCPKAPKVTRQGLLESIRKTADSTRNKIKKWMSNKDFSITFDHWTSIANENYVACTAHSLARTGEM